MTIKPGPITFEVPWDDRYAWARHALLGPARHPVEPDFAIAEVRITGLGVRKQVDTGWIVFERAAIAVHYGPAGGSPTCAVRPPA